jgi:hypothetical protein
MGSPTRFIDYCLSSSALAESELMVGKVANRIRAVPFPSIRASSTRRISPFGRRRESRPALFHLGHPPPKFSSFHCL